MNRQKQYLKNKRALYYYFNKSIRNPSIRNAMYRLVKCFVPKVEAPAPPKDEIDRLQKDGIFIWEQLIDVTAASRIREYLLTKPVYDFLEDFNPSGQIPMNMNEVDTTQQRKLKYFDHDIVQSKDIIDIANDPHIISLVSAYLGCKPTIVNMAAWWTKAGETPSDKFHDDMFHRDVDDYKFIKLFIYLNDVDATNGAHCFVRGSQLSARCNARRTFTDDEIGHAFGKTDQWIMTGSAGCGFLEDTWGFHRSLPCQQGERLVLHFLYGLTSFNAQTAPKPVAKNIYNVDTYSNRVYLY
jgi:hypothetical protein